MNKEIRMCCFCSVNLATTKDHILPKNAFANPRPLDLITVSAFRERNNGASKYDERFIPERSYSDSYKFAQYKYSRTRSGYCKYQGFLRSKMENSELSASLERGVPFFLSCW